MRRETADEPTRGHAERSEFYGKPRDRGLQPIDRLPAGEEAQRRATAAYETLDGWQSSTRGARSWAQLPAQAIKYVRYLEELIQCPVALLSTSPERDDTILMQDPFAV